MEHFDVIVIGTGVAGQTAAGELSMAGKKVAVVDKREFGGTCALRGCEPKKVLYAAAEVAERARGQAENGLSGVVAVDWPSLIAFKRTFTDPMSPMIEKGLVDGGAIAIHGTARFVTQDTIDVDGVQYSADHFVLAPGALPLPLNIPGQELVLDNEQFMASETLGSRVVFIGGGYISFEFAHIAATAGAKSTILHRSAQVLKEFDVDLAEMLVRSYRDAGIDVRTDAPVTAVRKAGGAFEVVLGDGAVAECDMVVHGAGRIPDLAGLDLEAGGIAFGRHGIEVDSSMRSTTNPRVFAAGDAAALGAPLTPVGIAQARIALANILEPGSATFAPKAVPSIAFSDPPLSSVGLTEAQAKAQGLDVEVKLTDTSMWASSRRTGVRISGTKTIVERGTGKIVGAHLLGHGADEVINVFATAIMAGFTAKDLKSAIWAYPTGGSEVVYMF
ncbi:MAG: NAD(P)/FAD-dependent oxidoreductase [Actinobacteria bacterium HGW-Actinobacteria-7]|jgi:glutathione reductase (NADPH)|nr:MAG: NAD(P)/FAD-dependent oxidoreductase [Actinobacteria bacterium HGW-Actinobacteria-7]